MRPRREMDGNKLKKEQLQLLHPRGNARRKSASITRFRTGRNDMAKCGMYCRKKAASKDTASADAALEVKSVLKISRAKHCRLKFHMYMREAICNIHTLMS